MSNKMNDVLFYAFFYIILVMDYTTKEKDFFFSIFFSILKKFERHDSIIYAETFVCSAKEMENVIGAKSQF